MVKNFKLLDKRSLLWPAERPNLAVINFAITLGLVWALLASIITILGRNLLVQDFIQFLENFYPGYGRPLGAFDFFLAVVYGLAHGFLFGLLVSYLYNIIKGPIDCGVELLKPQKIIESRNPWILSEGSSKNGNEPYTIAIVANPVLESEILPADEPLKWRRDPILNKPALFQSKVACIIGSLASNQMIRERFLDNDKMRIITYFNPDLVPQDKLIKDGKNALCLEKDFDIIIEPIQRQNGENRLNDFLDRELLDGSGNRFMVDVVFAVTASDTHTRSSALYTIDKKDPLGPLYKFRYKQGSPVIERHHAPFPEIPGLVAYSAWDTRLKTPLHEFAHAMSSTVNGLIHDEYYDDVPQPVSINNPPFPLDILGKNLLIINKQAGKTIPDVFGIYDFRDQERTFVADRAVIKPPDFEAFVPARLNPRVPCTMDISTDQDRFDRFIEIFMHDRLQVKSEREIV